MRKEKNEMEGGRSSVKRQEKISNKVWFEGEEGTGRQKKSALTVVRLNRSRLASTKSMVQSGTRSKGPNLEISASHFITISCEVNFGDDSTVVDSVLEGIMINQQDTELAQSVLSA